VSGKHLFRWAFLTVTVVALGAELWASFDSSAATEPWTDLITDHVPGEITAAAIGALVLWLPIHFWFRYRRKAKADKEIEG
jgi:hypothetical protein